MPKGTLEGRVEAWGKARVGWSKSGLKWELTFRALTHRNPHHRYLRAEVGYGLVMAWRAMRDFGMARVDVSSPDQPQPTTTNSSELLALNQPTAHNSRDQTQPNKPPELHNSGPCVVCRVSGLGDRGGVGGSPLDQILTKSWPNLDLYETLRNLIKSWETWSNLDLYRTLIKSWSNLDLT